MNEVRHILSALGNVLLERLDKLLAQPVFPVVLQNRQASQLALLRDEADSANGLFVVGENEEADVGICVVNSAGQYVSQPMSESEGL